MSRLMTMALTAAILAGAPAEAVPYERRRDQPKDVNPVPRKRAPRRYYQSCPKWKDGARRGPKFGTVEQATTAAEAKRARRRERNRRTR